MRRALYPVIVLVAGVLVAAEIFAGGGDQPQPPQPAQRPSQPAEPGKDSEAADPEQAAQAAESMGHHHHGAADPHMKMTAPRLANADDSRRADEIVKSLRVAIEPYRDSDRAQADGYKPFLPNLEMPQYHFTNWVRGLIGGFVFNPAKPTSLLYRRHDGRYELTGAMYTAPANATEEQLNARVPLSVAQWHLHVNICLPTAAERQHADWRRFGFGGSIATREACDAAGGEWHPQIFGWMVHVHPFESTAGAIWTN